MDNRTITTVTFDVGSTLLESSPEIDEMFYNVATKRGHLLDPEEVALQLPAVNEFYEQEYMKDGDFWCSPEGSVEIFLDMYRYLAYLVGLEKDAEDLSQAINREYRKTTSWMIYEDVLPCLRALKDEHISLGVISNWSTDLEDLLRGLYLLPYFDVVLASAQEGYRKPHPVIFELALERLAALPHHTIHVGDHMQADGEGAHAVGIKPLVIQRDPKGIALMDHPEIDVIQSLAEVLPYVTDRR